MSLEKWDPLRDLLSLQERMNRLFEESLAREHRDSAGLPSAWAPLADVVETDTAYLVELELPGLSRDDVELHADGHGLLVRGRRRAAREARPERFYRMERSYGDFQRAFQFEQEIATARVAADLRDGLLCIELPKAGAGTRRVPVERS